MPTASPPCTSSARRPQREQDAAPDDSERVTATALTVTRSASRWIEAQMRRSCVVISRELSGGWAKCVSGLSCPRRSGTTLCAFRLRSASELCGSSTCSAWYRRKRSRSNTGRRRRHSGLPRPPRLGMRGRRCVGNPGDEQPDPSVTRHANVATAAIGDSPQSRTARSSCSRASRRYATCEQQPAVEA
jgi:hypothetical protein